MHGAMLLFFRFWKGAFIYSLQNKPTWHLLYLQIIDYNFRLIKSLIYCVGNLQYKPLKKSLTESDQVLTFQRGRSTQTKTQVYFSPVYLQHPSSSPPSLQSNAKSQRCDESIHWPSLHVNWSLRHPETKENNILLIISFFFKSYITDICNYGWFIMNKSSSLIRTFFHGNWWLNSLLKEESLHFVPSFPPFQLSTQSISVSQCAIHTQSLLIMIPKTRNLQEMMSGNNS